MVNFSYLGTALVAATSLFQRAPTNHSIAIPNLGDSALVDWAFVESQKIFNSSASNCTKCVESLNLGKYLTRAAPSVTPLLLVKLCWYYNWQSDCDTWQATKTTQGDLGKHLSQAFTLIDAFGLEGQLFCNWQVPHTCESVDVPKPDLSSWWPGKPSKEEIQAKSRDLQNAESSDEREKPASPVFNVLHISDFHLDLRYLPGQEAWCDIYMCCTVASHNKAAIAAGLNHTVQSAQKLGSYHCDAPVSLVEDSMKSVGALAKARDFEFGLFTGDMISHDYAGYLSLGVTYQSEEECYYLMKKYLGDIPVYPTFGNHDSYPAAQLAQNASGYAGDFSWNAELSAKLWKDFGWINETTEAEAEHTYGSFAVTTKRGLRVISIDSNLWYGDNYYCFWNVTQPDLSGIFKWLVSELLECELLGQKAWIMSHVPAQDLGAVPWVSEVLSQVIRRFSPHVIAASFWGHTHADQFNVFYENEGVWTEDSALSVGWITQSVTPIDLYNPAWRYYQVNADTFEIMDSRNYYSPLNETYEYSIEKYTNETVGNFTYKVFEPQTPKNMTWMWEYSAREAYDFDGTWPEDASLNATFWHRAAKQIVQQPTSRQLYYDHYYRKSPYTITECEGECLKETYCSFVAGSSGERKRCLKLDKLPEL